MGSFAVRRRFIEADTPLHERAEIARSLQIIDRSLRGIFFWMMGVNCESPRRRVRCAQGGEVALLFFFKPCRNPQEK